MKTKQRKVFERVVNPLLIKHLVSAHLNTVVFVAYQLNT